MKNRMLLRMMVLSCMLWGGLLHNPLSMIHCSLSIAQAQTFTEHLTRSKSGEGSVILHQDSEIEALVNGNKLPASSPSTVHLQNQQSDVHSNQADSLAGSGQQPLQGRRVKTTGFRIQVYAGGNNRQSKGEAYRMASLVRSTFSDVPVYTNFISPRWTCRVGDFKTREEATEMLERMRETQKFREATIVKSQIVLLY